MRKIPWSLQSMTIPWSLQSMKIPWSLQSMMEISDKIRYNFISSQYKDLSREIENLYFVKLGAIVSAGHIWTPGYELFSVLMYVAITGENRMDCDSLWAQITL